MAARTDLSQTMNSTPKKLFIANSDTKDALSGLCMVFTRSGDKAISNLGIMEVGFVVMDCNSGLLNGLEKLFQGVFAPALQVHDQWGEPDTGSASAKPEFLENLNKFVNILSTARTNMSGRVVLSAGDLKETLDAMKGPSDHAVAANNVELLDSIEELIMSWIKQIEQVLAQSEQMRKEADNIGPSAELDHWRKRMAKFNSLLGQLKSSHCKAAIGVLYAARSRCLKYWRELDSRITDAANEAKDNVKYLYTLDRLLEPLVKCAPVSIKFEIRNPTIIVFSC